MEHAEYRAYMGRRWRFAIVSALILVVLSLLALSLGSTWVPFPEIVRSVAALLVPTLQVNVDPASAVIIQHFRLPRIVMAVMAGFGLGMSGAVMQGVLRNPLVSPTTIGVSGGAVLGASLAIVLGFDLIGISKYVVIGNAFVFAMGTSMLILFLGRLRSVSPESFILVGIALMSFFGAFTALLQFVAGDDQLAQVVHWTFGTLTGSNWSHIVLSGIVIAVSIPFLVKLAWDLNAMASGGDELAASLGVRCGRVRVISMLLASLMTATIISFTGLIGFVGLVAPHITRSLTGTDHRFLIPFSGLTSAILLLCGDTIARTAFAPVILPVGIVTSFLGAPFFFYLLMVKRGQYWQ